MSEVEAAAARSRARALVRHPHAALAAVLLSTFVLSVDSASVNVALPHIRGDFGAGSSVTWVVTAYLLGSMVAISVSSWASARWGIRRPMLVTTGCFVGGSLLSAAAPNLGALIAARTFVGMFGTPLIPISMTLVTRIYPPHRRGWAISVWSIAGLSGPTLGPSVGGRIADVASWRWLFLSVAPIAAVALVIAWVVIPDIGDGTPGTTRGPDVIGLLLGAPGICLTVLFLTRGRTWGWSSPITIVSGLVGVTLVVAFARRSLGRDEPLLDLRLFAVPRFALGAAMTALSTFTLNSRLVFVPLELTDARGWDTTFIGVLFLPIAVASAVGLAITGRVVDRRGPRGPLIAGASLIFAGSVALALWRVDTPTWLLLVGMGVHGVGQGLFMGTTVSVSFSRVATERLPQASTIRQMAQQFGGVLASGLLGSLLGAFRDHATTAGAIQRSYDVVFIAAAAVAFVLLVLTARVPRGPMHV